MRLDVSRPLGATIAAMTLVIGGMPTARAAQLVSNGDFETGDFTGWSYKAAGSKVEKPTRVNLGGVALVKSHDSLGKYAAFLAVRGSGWLEQQLPTIAGDTYEMSFDLAVLGAGDRFSVNIGPTSIVPEQLPQISDKHDSVLFEAFDTEFLATADNELLRFNFRDNKGHDLVLDNVSVTPVGVSVNAAVPEPSTWAMMLIGFAVVGSALRKRALSRLAA